VDLSLRARITDATEGPVKNYSWSVAVQLARIAVERSGRRAVDRQLNRLKEDGRHEGSPAKGELSLKPPVYPVGEM